MYLKKEYLTYFLQGFGYFLIGSFFVIYLIFYDFFRQFNVIIKQIGPFVVLFGLLIVKLGRMKEVILSRNPEEKEIYITTFDELKYDLVVFTTTALVLLLPYLFSEKISVPTIVQASGVFAIMYWAKRIFVHKV